MSFNKQANLIKFFQRKSFVNKLGNNFIDSRGKAKEKCELMVQSGRGDLNFIRSLKKSIRKDCIHLKSNFVGKS